MERYLSLSQVCKITTLSASTIYRNIKKGQFPSGSKLTVGRRGWSTKEIELWLNRRENLEDKN